MRVFLRACATAAAGVGVWLLATTTVAGRQGVTITAPAAGTVLREGPDFATDQYGDPWDFRNLQDIAPAPFLTSGWQLTPQGFIDGRAPFLNTAEPGAFVGVTNGDQGIVPLMYRGASNLVNVASDRAAVFDRFAIPTARYGKFAVKTRVDSTPNNRPVVLHWFFDVLTPANLSSDARAGGIEFYGAEVIADASKIYVVDLASRQYISGNGIVRQGTLLGPITPASVAPWNHDALVRGLLLVPYSGHSGAGVAVNVDWVRLTAADNQPGAAMTPVQFQGCPNGTTYVIEATEENGTNDEATVVLGSGSAATGAVSTAVNHGVLAPGNWDWRVRCGNQQSALRRIVVNSAPAVTVRDPDVLGGEDFATAVLANPWDMNATTDVASTSNITSVTIVNDPQAPGTNAYQATATSGDPVLAFLNFSSTLLSSRKYHNLTFSLTLDTPFELNGLIGGGSIMRLHWASPGMNPTVQTATNDMLVWPRRTTYTIDLASLSTANLDVNSPRVPWPARTISGFRLDPHESTPGLGTPVFPFRVGPMSLTADDAVVLGGTFDIRYSIADADGPGSTYVRRVYLDNDLDPASKWLLANSAPAAPGDGTFPFNPQAQNVSAGDYHVYVEVTETRGTLTDTRGAYSTGILRVISPTASSPQTPVLNPGAGSTQPLLFNVTGCAYDANAPGGIGVDDVTVFAIPGAGVTELPGQTRLLGYGHGLGTISFAPLNTPVVCPTIANSSSPFYGSGFSIANVGLTPGNWTLRTISRSTISGEFTQVDTPFQVTDRPLAPANFTVTADGNRVTLSFAAPTGGPPPGRYALDVGRDQSMATLAFTLDIPAPGTYSGDLPNGIWHFRLTSLRADGLRGIATNVVSLVLPGGAPPPPPPGPPVLAAAVVTGNHVSLSWSAGPGGAPSSYTLVAGTAAGAANLATIPMGGATSIGASVGNGAYFVRIIASNLSGTATSNEIVFTIGPTALPGVPGMNPPSVSGGQVTLTWTTPAGSPTSYTILARLAPGGPVVAALPVTGNAVTVPAPAGTYFVTIVATNSLGSSAESNQITVVVP